jgi:hypothetical protein
LLLGALDGQSSKLDPRLLINRCAISLIASRQSSGQMCRPSDKPADDI